MLANEYRTARQAQDAKYEDATGLPVGDTGRQEYRDFFGVGDHAGRPIERRVTPHDWLTEHAAEQPPATITEDQAFYMTGRDLAELAAAGDFVAANEIVRRAIQRVRKTGRAA